MKLSDTFKIAPSGQREIIMTRVFDAPRDLVFDALTKPDLVKRWLLGPPGWSMPVCEIDLKVGGKYRYVWRNEDGREMGMGGTYREIVRPAKLVHTELFDEARYAGESLNTWTLTEKNGTVLSVTTRYEIRETRDEVLKSGMETGVSASYDRLDEILASARSAKR
ncbi:MAG: SRPBCC family protein [Gemmatimonadaceae bacterium]|nr:SRPBCC family protein [Gemmatimonadaceae bacterium]